ncbi:non-ribosomal peptide synthetase [Acetivibrio cellulolyticus]|uniref:non-ribosomal peptide synthetase n=1 Tax=Acetivibrio cellulolyticus TaxID=35830 RepID=UPI00030EB8CD|nr:non-ribosomal peptide synthetase [Acetivibrio cellulolyticus]
MMKEKEKKSTVLLEKGIEEAKKYWLEKLSAEMCSASLSFDFMRSQEYEKAKCEISFDRSTVDKLLEIIGDSELDLYISLLSVYKVLLFKYTGQEDITVASPVFGADCKTNRVIPVRDAIDDEISFKELVNKVAKSVTEAYENQCYPIAELVKMLGMAENKNSFANTVLIFENIHERELCIEEEALQAVFVSFRKEGKKLSGNITYNSKVYSEDTIKRLSNRYSHVLSQVLKDMNIKIADIELITKDERKQILTEFNKTTTQFPWDKTICELFEEQAEKVPENTALIFGNKAMTYRELNTRSNQLARLLREKIGGISSNPVIGIMMERSMEMLIGILGILKAGGAYLPIDPGHPTDRIRHMLEDSKAALLLTEEKLFENWKSLDIQVINIKDELLYNGDGSNLPKLNKSTDLAYVMYTSGSTGKPKGNLITHYNISRVVRNTNYIDISSKDTLLQLSNYAFDGSVFDIYGALLNGAKLVLVNKETILDMPSLSELIKNQGITVFFLTTALFNTLVDINIGCFENIRKVLFGGERVSIPHVRKALEYMGPGRIIHVYGPTESTVYATYHFVDKIDINAVTIPIGKPLSNTQVYIVGKNNRLQPIGVPGELCISGQGLAGGYLNNPELTKEKFVSNPFEKELSDLNPDFPSDVMYRTGDLARWLPDGNIEFLGRIDYQVKIRGFRIELEEIENQLMAHEAVKETVVIDRIAEDGTKYLCAYFASDKKLAPTQLMEHLSQTLPDYMIPSYFVQMDNLPLTLNGKVNRKALPEPDRRMNEDNDYSSPANDTEKKLAEVWQQVLGVDKVSTTGRFLEMGGDSIKAIKIAAEAAKLGINIKVSDIFKFRTISKIADSVKNTGVHEKTLNDEAMGKTDSCKLLEVNSGKKCGSKNRDIRILPINLQTDVTTYLHRSLPLCAVLSDEKNYPWFYRHFIQVFSTTHTYGTIRLEYLEKMNFYSEIYDEVCYGYKDLEAVEDIIKFIVDKIDSGHYIIINVDEYYLRQKNRYMKEHFVHQQLVYGYDNVQRKIMAVGFDSERIFTDIEFDYNDFAESYEKGKVNCNEFITWVNERAIQTLTPKDIRGEYDFGPGYFGEQLNKYLNSSNANDETVYDFASTEDLKKCDPVRFGIDYHDALIQHIQNVLNGNFTVYYNCFHLLYEHKKGIIDRLQYICKTCNDTEELEVLIEEYSKILAKANAIRLKAFEMDCEAENTEEHVNPMQTLPYEYIKPIMENFIDEIRLIKSEENLVLKRAVSFLSAMH